MAVLAFTTMADDKKIKDYRDRVRINVNEPYEVEYWSKKFKVTPAKLRAAVKTVGVSVKKVEAHLRA
jgi:Protein of unknown function (DUF3606)